MASHTASLSRIKYLLAQVEMYKLSVPEWIKGLKVEYIQDTYNGAGPDWLPAKYRKILTWLLGLFECCYLIHDLEFKFSDKSIHGFNRSNSRLWTNIRRVINYEYSLWNPFNWIARCVWYFRGRASYIACKRFGWSAWRD